MPRKILFTPVGTTDPISTNRINNEQVHHDGAILHICRHYDITEVHLYMSREMLDFQSRDDRYRSCLGKLSEKMGRQIAINLIERPDLNEAQDFNFFYREFDGILSNLYAGCADGDELYVNISSGTPAMKGCLYALVSMRGYPATIVQVTTPTRQANVRRDEEDWDIKWLLNEDNGENPNNRCVEVTHPPLSTIRDEETLKRLVREYDYHAAVVMAEGMPAYATARYLPYLRFAEARKRLDSDVANRCRNLAEEFIPVRQGDKMKLVEYALELDLKRRRGEYADFLRALTPLFAELLILILRNAFQVDVNQYCNRTRKGLSWNMCRLNDGTDVEQILRQNPRFQGGYVMSSHLIALVDAYAGSDTQELKTSVDCIRKVEESVRNLVAHQVVGITGDVIYSKAKLAPDQIMAKIKSLFAYAGIRVNDNTWNSYDKMNEEIIGLIGKAPDTPR